MNINKDKMEQSDKLLKICQHLRPEVYFKQKPTENTATDFAADIAAKLGRSLTEEEIMGLGIDLAVPDVIEEDVDTIERI